MQLSSHPPLQANRMLRLLPENELTALKADLHDIMWGHGETVYEIDAPAEHVYFPVGAVSSTIIMMENGTGVETNTTGREGMLGANAALGSDAMTAKVICQVAGPVYCMRLAAFKDHLHALPVFRDLVSRFNVTLLQVVSQTAACNRLHHINQRLIRWLLMTHDRVFNGSFKLTHEFISLMLGVNRPTVTIAAAALQQAGFIKYHRGLVTILDREKLEEACCECYSIVKRQFELLLPDGVEVPPEKRVWL